MSNPYLGETRTFAFAFAPPGWLACEGQLLAISEFETLFQLIGTTYGGDGQTTFALPDATGPDSDGVELTVCISLFGMFPAT